MLHSDDESSLADLLELIGNSLNSLEFYTEIAPTETMNKVIFKILVELLSTTASAIKGTKQGKLSEFIVGEGIHCLTYERRKTCWEACW